MTDYRRLRVALLGAGAVGSQVAGLLRKHGDELADRAGAELDLSDERVARSGAVHRDPVGSVGPSSVSAAITDRPASRTSGPR